MFGVGLGRPTACEGAMRTRDGGCMQWHCRKPSTGYALVVVVVLARPSYAATVQRTLGAGWALGWPGASQGRGRLGSGMPSVLPLWLIRRGAVERVARCIDGLGPPHRERNTCTAVAHAEFVCILCSCEYRGTVPVLSLWNNCASWCNCMSVTHAKLVPFYNTPYRWLSGASTNTPWRTAILVTRKPTRCPRRCEANTWLTPLTSGETSPGCVSLPRLAQVTTISDSKVTG